METRSSASIAVLGAGYVGLTSAVAFAHLGHRVICADIDAAKVAMLQRGEIPIVEDGLEAMATEVVAAGRLSYSTDVPGAAAASDVVFLCVQTPTDDTGRADLAHIVAASSMIGPHLRPGSVVVNKSTVPVGTTAVVASALGRDDVSVVSNPEFLREGTALHDFLHPDRVVVGATDADAADLVAGLYASVDTQVLVTDPASAETIKYAANAFLATKISFANGVAALCEAVGADITDVAAGVGADRRIGHDFLRPGPGWGGSCLPKDTSALVTTAADHGYDFAFVQGVIAVNIEQRRRIVDKVRRAAGGDLDGATVAAFGLTFKAHTDDLRDSPALAIIGDLVEGGATVRSHDPTVTRPLTTPQQRVLGSLAEALVICDDPIDAATGCTVAVVLTEWPDYADIDLERLATVMAAGGAVVDARNLMAPDAVRKAGLEYDGVGRR